MQAVSRTEQQQCIADLQAFVREFGANGLTLTPDAGQLDTEALAKIEFTHGAAGQPAAWIERGVHECQSLGFERPQVCGDAGFDLELLQTT